MKDKNLFRGKCLDLGAGAEGCAVKSFEDIVLPPGITLVMPQQTHTSNVDVVSSHKDVFPDTDALISMDSNIAVGVRTADCVPILIHAADIGAVAAVHAGWKGTVSKIVSKTIGELIKFGARPCNMYAAIGPAICGECYETGAELAEIFKSAGLENSILYGCGEDPLQEKIFNESTIRIDLIAANVSLLFQS